MRSVLFCLISTPLLVKRGIIMAADRYPFPLCVQQTKQNSKHKYYCCSVLFYTFPVSGCRCSPLHLLIHQSTAILPPSLFMCIIYSLFCLHSSIPTIMDTYAPPPPPSSPFIPSSVHNNSCIYLPPSTHLRGQIFFVCYPFPPTPRHLRGSPFPFVLRGGDARKLENDV